MRLFKQTLAAIALVVAAAIAAESQVKFTSGMSVLPSFVCFTGCAVGAPALKRSATQLQVRLGNDSNWGNIAAANVTAAVGGFYMNATSQQGNPGVNYVILYMREDVDSPAGAATADCAIWARTNDGTETLIKTLLTDTPCP